MSSKYACLDKVRPEHLMERHVQAIWYDCELRPKGLVTNEGAAVRVVHPGVWNQEAGPDFKNAVLEIATPTDIKTVRGDVEVHLSPRDWEAHGHSADPRYESVIAHVTWYSGDVPRSLPARAVSIAVGDLIAADPTFSLDRIDLGAYPFGRLPATTRPCQETFAENAWLSRDLLGDAGRFRLEMKARRLGMLLENHLCGRTQLFYEEVMAALGYKGNSHHFRSIAKTVPYDRLIAEPENAVAALHSAGEFIPWNRLVGRPTNSPFARLAAAATLFTETDILSALETDDFSPKGCRALIRLLTQNRLMGRGRAAAILANVIVPFAIYEGRLAALEELDWLPPEDVSQPIRLMAFRLLGSNHNPSLMYARDGLRIQGLFQVDRMFCTALHPECNVCYLSREGSLPKEDVRLEYGT